MSGQRELIRALLAERYHGAVEPTEAMIDAVLAGLPEVDRQIRGNPAKCAACPHYGECPGLDCPLQEHDEQCENLPGGQYHGKTIGGGLPGYEPMPIPCHCQARADGRAQAEREIRRAARS